jgi:hypothetical protein
MDISCRSKHQLIRIRAERRCGELLLQMDKAKGANQYGNQRARTRNTSAITPDIFLPVSVLTVTT